MAQIAKPTAASQGGKFQDKDKPMEVRMSNITAAKGKLEISHHIDVSLIYFFFFFQS